MVKQPTLAFSQIMISVRILGSSPLSGSMFSGQSASGFLPLQYAECMSKVTGLEKHVLSPSFIAYPDPLLQGFSGIAVKVATCCSHLEVPLGKNYSHTHRSTLTIVGWIVLLTGSYKEFLFLPSCWLKITLSLLPCMPLHGEVHNLAACFKREGRRE